MTAAPGVGLPDLQALLDPALRADPCPAYRRWRTATTIARPMAGFLVLARHGDCAAVLRDTRFEHEEGPRRRPAENTLVDEQGRPVRGFLTLNPPGHTRLRGPVSKAFTRRTVERLAPRIEQITAGLLDAVGDGPADLVRGDQRVARHPA
jgi:cytochrome P450